jgi:hypothetical protein
MKNILFLSVYSHFVCLDSVLTSKVVTFGVSGSVHEKRMRIQQCYLALQVILLHDADSAFQYSYQVNIFLLVVKLLFYFRSLYLKLPFFIWRSISCL